MWFAVMIDKPYLTHVAPMELSQDTYVGPINIALLTELANNLKN
jgi:hypothetical protein